MKIPMALWPRLMPLLEQALDLPAAQRPAWLAVQALDDDTRAALLQLLADRAQLDGGDFMAALPQLEALSPGAMAGRAHAPQPLDGAHGHDAAERAGAAQLGLFPGDLIGSYRLIRQLGQGGMSVVWLAERDDGQMRRHVALKMPHAGPGQALLAERLRRERDILASLEHRHIARLYDVGSTAQGLPFLVLEYIEGESLPAYCDAHQLGVNERLRLFLQVLGAVQYAHTKLVLHRDLKPGNILVNRQGEVKLLDFGIAKLIRDGETGAAPSTELTQHNGQVLTPDYAAPEQIAGQPLTTASDVYALGVILFELLTGQRPYRLPRGTRGALEEAILATDPRRPSQVWQDADVQTHHLSAATLSDLAGQFGASPRKLSQRLKGDLDVVVATALQKQTARRYPTAEAFAQDITHHLAREPIAAQPDSRWYRGRKYVQRHAWALTAVAAVVTALSVGLGVALWQAQQARQEAAKANAIKDFLVGLFENGDVEQPDALRKRQQTVEQLLVTSARALGSQLKDQPAVRVELQGVVGGLLHSLAITDAAIDLRRQRVAQLEAMGASVAERAQALRDLADSQDVRGDTAAARASLARGLALCQQAAMQPWDVCYGLQVATGALQVRARDLPGAQGLIEPALQLLKIRAPRSAAYAEALVAMGDLLSLKNDNQASFELYEQAMQVRSRLWGAQSVRLAQERYLLASSLGQVGRVKQAQQEFDAALAAMSAALGKEHLNSALIELQLGRLRSFIGQQTGGREQVLHASGIIQAQAASVDPRTLFLVQQALAEIALFDGRLAEAGPHLREALRMQASLGDSLPQDGHLELAMAWYLDDAGQFEASRALLLRTRQQLRRTLGEQHPYVLAINEAVGTSYLAQEDWAQAAAWLKAKGRVPGEGDGSLAAAAAPAPSSSSSSAQTNTPAATPDEPASTAAWAAWLMATGRFKEAEPLVKASYEATMRTPREDQFRLSIFNAHDQMGRLQMGLGQPALARPYFERAIQAMASGYAFNPYLAATRARYGLCLLALGDAAGAAAQAQLSAKAFKEGEAQVAGHFKAPLQALKAKLSGA